MSTKKSALGRGLSVLLENPETDITLTTKKYSEPAVAGTVSSVSVALIEANPFQPRTHFEKEALAELADSIKEHGIIQPITVRKMGYDRYQLISGERRFKASQIVGLTSIPAYIRIANDQTMLEMALVENIQREDLDAIEIALSYKRLVDECKITQEELSKKVSKQRSTITNYLRLLKLPVEIQAGIRDRKISMGHARALINIGDEKTQLKAYRDILSNELSVRQVEEYTRTKQAETSSPSKNKKTKTPLSFSQQKISNELSNLFGTKVSLQQQAGGKGKITIHFSSEDEFDKILTVLDIG